VQEVYRLMRQWWSNGIRDIRPWLTVALMKRHCESLGIRSLWRLVGLRKSGITNGKQECRQITMVHQATKPVERVNYRTTV
jgi:hypothetical protein